MSEDACGTENKMTTIPPTPPVLTTPTQRRHPLVLITGVVLLLCALFLSILAVLSVGTFTMPKTNLPPSVLAGLPSFRVAIVEFTFGALTSLIMGIGLLKMAHWARRGATVTISIFLSLEIARALYLHVLLARPEPLIRDLMQPTGSCVLVGGVILLILNLPVTRTALDKR